MTNEPTGPPGSAAPFWIGEWRVDPSVNELVGRTGTVRVEPKVMGVLLCLAERAGELVTRESLMESVWAGTVVTEQVLSRAVSVLRKGLADDSRRPSYIQTIPKRGYRLIAPVTRSRTRDRSRILSSEPPRSSISPPVPAQQFGKAVVGLALLVAALMHVM